MSEVEIVEVTWMRAFKVWWSLLWRGLLFCFLGGGLVGFTLGFFLGLAKVEPETIKSACTISGYIVSIPIGIVVTRLVLNNRYSDFKIVLINNKN